VTVFNRFFAEVEGTGHGATLWGLLMCWDLRAVRGSATADVWLAVTPQSQQV
jgi:hypothetical protein